MKSGLQCRVAPVVLAVALVAATPVAAQGLPATAEPALDSNTALDPESPLAELPDIGVDWPDLPAEEAGEQASGVDSADEQGRRYTVTLAGVPSAPENQISQRFDVLSALKIGGSKPANVAQIDRRARDDAALLAELLRADGYYDAVVDSEIEAVGDRIAVTLTIEPGPLYTFGDIRVSGLDADGTLREAYNVKVQDSVDADDVTLADATLKSKLANDGYPFAKVTEPDVVVDHDTRTATLEVHVETGGKRNFGQILARGEKQPFGAKHIGVIARFKPGEPYNQADIDDLKRALIATGLLSSVDVSPVETGDPQTADVAVTMTPAPLRTIAAEAGYGTGEGFRLSASWTHRNLIKPEGAVTLSGVIGTREQSLGGALRQSNWRRRDWILNARVAASNVVRTAYEARTFEVAANIERQTNIIWQKNWTWSAGFELLASDERDIVANGGARQTYFIGALPGTLAFDGSDDLLDPTRGFRLSGRISPEGSLQGGFNGYVRAQIDGSAYLPVGSKVVLAGRARLGSISGTALTNIAPSRRYYAGGGGSVRGFSYQDIGPRDAFGDPIGGRSLAEFSLEARIRFGVFGVVPFVDAGNIYTSAVPSLDKMRIGAGLGGRYYSSFGPIRLDIGTPINRRTGEARVTVFVSLGQAF
jgi:translocation and assembly module TamA